jgi:hypothetical protein
LIRIGPGFGALYFGIRLSKQRKTKPMIEDWRQRLRRDISWLLLLKCALLVALWACFFSGSHRCRVDASATASRMALSNQSAGGNRCD